MAEGGRRESGSSVGLRFLEMLLIEVYRCCRSCEFRDVSSWRKESKFIAMTGSQRQVMKIQSRQDKRRV